jgi:hypothetical protein
VTVRGSFREWGESDNDTIATWGETHANLLYCYSDDIHRDVMILKNKMKS